MPVRTCAVCRVRAERSELLRLVLRDGSAVLDLKGTAAGRGAWLHPGCLSALVARPGLGARAFRGPAQVSPDLVARVCGELDRWVGIAKAQAARLGMASDDALRWSRNLSALRKKMALRREVR